MIPTKAGRAGWTGKAAGARARPSSKERRGRPMIRPGLVLSKPAVVEGEAAKASGSRYKRCMCSAKRDDKAESRCRSCGAAIDRQRSSRADDS